MPLLVPFLNSSLFFCVLFCSSVSCSFAYYLAVFRVHFYSFQKLHFHFHIIHIFHSHTTYTSTKVLLALKQVSVPESKQSFEVYFFSSLLFCFDIWFWVGFDFVFTQELKQAFSYYSTGPVTLYQEIYFITMDFFPDTTSMWRESKRGQ